MARLIDLVTLDRMDNLIRRQATGTPDELAMRLGISRSTLFEYIKYCNEVLQASIRYNKYEQWFYYEYPPDYYLGFEKDRSKPGK
jgi:response regulator of citrate/malate metabolism